MTAPWVSGNPMGFGNGAGRTVQVPPSQTGPDAVTSPTRTLQLPLPDVYPVPSATEFNVTGSVASAAVLGNVAIPGALVTVPANTLVRISAVLIDIDDMLETTNVTWTLFVDQNPKGGFSNLSIFPRAAPFVGRTLDAFLRFEGPCNIQLTFSNLDGGTYLIGGGFSGWYWSTAADALWKQGATV